MEQEERKLWEEVSENTSGRLRLMFALVLFHAAEKTNGGVKTFSSSRSSLKAMRQNQDAI